ncbi:hypothetical protein HanPSC8_Chr11g0453311 [Helianthus annuus]|nr:hypothetical protein HanPSC8_Chr11g0453311 [Helianthus annuus]
MRKGLGHLEASGAWNVNPRKSNLNLSTLDILQPKNHVLDHFPVGPCYVAFFCQTVGPCRFHAGYDRAVW